MKILLVSTLKRKVTSDEFASRSRVIFQLASGLVKKGHQVSLLGTGDSDIPGVEILPVIEKGWVDLPPVENEFVRDTGTLTTQAQMMVQLQDRFDIIHNHTFPDFYPHILENELKIPLVTTLHAVAEPYLDEVLAQFQKSYFVALSEGYTKKLSKTKPVAVVYNGVDTSLYAYSDKKEEYLFWIGRLNSAKDEQGNYIDPKGVRWAIRLAEETGQRLYMLGPVHDKKAFEIDVKPHLSDTIQWVGEVSPEQSVPVEKVIDLMQHAKAFLMTVNQEEPFGLVMAEAGSCGTPVIAWDRGSVPEVVIDGKTGSIVPPEAGIEGLKKAVENVGEISPQDCRNHIEEHFSVEAMVSNYEKVYEELRQRK